MNIPIQNIYYLLIYAWDSLEEAEIVNVDIQESTKIVDLFARVLNSGLEHLLRRGLDRSYIIQNESIVGVKGKLDISTSIKLSLFPQGRAACEFDDLSHNVTHNRIIKTTIHRLIRVSNIDPNLRNELVDTYRRLGNIDELRISEQVFRSVQLHRNNQFYRFLLEVCHLIHENLLVDEASGQAKFRDFIRDDRAMSSVFEKFVRNFYRHEQNVFSVGRERIRWQQTTGSDHSIQLLPTMMTDISLVCADRKIVIDTKFYREALQKHYGKLSLRSEHLYQMFAYMKNLKSMGKVNEKVEGILMYPSVSIHLDASYKMHGHDLRVCTIDLNQPWRQIYERLMGVVISTTSV